MKLLIVTQTADREDTNLGAFYYWFELLARHASSVTIMASRVGTTDFPSNVEVYSLGKEKGYGKLRRLWRFWILFARHFARADAVLFHQIPEFAIAAFPFIVGRKQTTALWYAHGGVSWRLRMAERFVDHIVTSSEAGFRLPSKKVHHMGQAINTELFSLAPHRPVSKKNPLRFVSVGRISPVKDYETIINAAALLRDTWDRAWTLTLVGSPITPGDFAYAEKIKAFVREKNLEDRIRFSGDRHYSEIPGILKDHDIFLNASRTGSLDKAVLEAMACGLSVLTSNDAYRAILPPQYFIDRPSAEEFAARIKTLSREKRPVAELRDIVVRDHALDRMVETMAHLLAKPV
ncbi:MAG: glycosyltransferase family 4 protein [Candidatus Sungbacteria bacterium]|nr:glycosyltransferase family 4 protein [Candidatus Sungbacteria bacterium]